MDTGLFAANADAALKQALALVDVQALLLVVLLAVGLWVIWRAQRRADFDWADALRDEAGKPSALRFGVLVAIAVTSWVVMKVALAKSEDLPQIFWAYLFAWSGAPILREVAAKWNGVLPWSKP